MTGQRTAGRQPNRPATSGQQPRIARAMRGVLWLLAVLVWRRGHGPGWPVVVSVGLLVAILVQSVVGMNGLLAVHVPLGVAIFGLVATLLGRTRTRSATRPRSPIMHRPAP
jgi:heme A synthase